MEPEGVIEEGGVEDVAGADGVGMGGAAEQEVGPVDGVGVLGVDGIEDVGGEEGSDGIPGDRVDLGVGEAPEEGEGLSLGGEGCRGDGRW